MERGNVVEYIDKQKIVCAVILEVKSRQLRLLNEKNREVKISFNRIAHQSDQRLDIFMGRDALVAGLKELAAQRCTLTETVDVKELWEIVQAEQEWIDLATMTGLCFPDYSSKDYESAVLRAFFSDRTYFRFKPDQFFPYTEEEVRQMIRRREEEAERNRLIELAANWLKNIINENHPSRNMMLKPEEENRFIDILRSVYLFEKESPDYDMGKSILSRAGVDMEEYLFKILVKLGTWDQDENVDLYKFEIPTEFSDKVFQQTSKLISGAFGSFNPQQRRDLTRLSLITIDGQSTMDFDDALSIENKGDSYLLGIHIADVGHHIKRDDFIDREAFIRGSSIYMPDMKIPMLPPSLAEDLCSLKAGLIRPAISILIDLTPEADIIDYEIVPSLINVQHQLTYYDANLAIETDPDIQALYSIADKFQNRRLSEGAIQISLPEVNVWFSDDGELNISKINREGPSRKLVSELMIMANWLMARFLRKEGIPAVFRSQPAPKDRLYAEDGGTLFQNWMQRKLLSRFVLSHHPEPHSALGLNSYLTATSPIRKYLDLITQRQIRAALGLEDPYTVDEIDQAIQFLEQPLSHVSRIQYRRKRYWLLKYLERKIGKKEEAIVLNKRKDSYLALITEYLIECMVPLSGGIKLKPQDCVRLTIQNVNARKDQVSVYLS